MFNAVMVPRQVCVLAAAMLLFLVYVGLMSCKEGSAKHSKDCTCTVMLYCVYLNEVKCVI